MALFCRKYKVQKDCNFKKRAGVVFTSYCMRGLCMKKNNFFAKACFLTLLVFSFIACEIGLGGAVDTQPPSITIDSPEADAVIRDIFLISGSWKDDGTIASVQATLVRTDKEGESVIIKGDFDKIDREGGSWKVLVNYEENNLKDGTYLATISIKDKSGRETIQNTTFTIDNTPPVLVLSRPSTKCGVNNFDSYGQTFTLEGKAADDNDVSLIEVNIYEHEDSTEALKSIKLTGLPLTIEQDVAVYEAGKANDYAIIYKHTDENGIIMSDEITKGISEQRYCTLTIYDGAQRYPVDGSEQTEEDKKGNSTNSYYLNSEISNILAKYKINELYHIQNGTFKQTGERSISVETVAPSLAEKAISKSQFSINPSNNPKYVVTSRSPLKDQEKLSQVNYQLTEGNSYIEVEITPGLDKWPIDADSVGVYLLECEEDASPKEKDENGNDIQPIWLIEPGAENHTAEKATIVQAGDSFKFKTHDQISKKDYTGLKIGSFYLIKVVGNDKRDEPSGREIISDGTFGFKLVSTGDLIELSGHGEPEYISQIQDAWSVEGHEKFKITLSWTSTETDFDVIRKFDNSNTETTISSDTKKPYKKAGEETIWQFDDEIDYDLLNGNSFPNSISYTLKKGGDEVSTKANIRLRYDNEAPQIPEIENIVFTNSYLKIEEDENKVKHYTYFIKNDGKKVSSITGTATDNISLESVELIVPGYKENIGKQTSGRFTFAGLNFKPANFEGTAPNQVTAQIIVTDGAGNQSNLYDIQIVFDTQAPRAIHGSDAKGKDIYFNVNEKDNDDISPDDLHGLIWDSYTYTPEGQTEPVTLTGIDTSVGGKYGAGTYGNSGTVRIRGNFTDDGGSGIKMIYYKIYDRTNTQWIYDNDNNEEKHDLSDDELQALINDVLANNKYFAPLESPEYKRVFYNVIKNGTDSYGGKKLSGYNNDKYDKYWKLIENNFNTTISGFNEGANYLVLVAQDNVGNYALNTAEIDYVTDDSTTPPTTEKRVYSNTSVNVDSTGPKITERDDNNSIYTNGGELPLIVEVIDPSPAGIENACSGVDTVIFTTERSGITYSVPANPVEGQNNKWSADISSLLPADAQKGTYTIRVNATDVAGTSSKIDYASVVIDKIPPKVEFTSPLTGATVNKEVILKGTVTDNSGAGVDITNEKAPKLYWTTNQEAKETDPNPEALEAKAADGWVELADSGWDDTDELSWKFTIDTTTLRPNGTDLETDVVPDGKTVFFTVSASDTAGSGNTGYAQVHELIIDQNSDRPVIKFSNLNITNMTDSNRVWITKEDMYASINDDDGEVEAVKISFDGTNWDEKDDQGNYYYTKENGLSITLPSDKDGEQQIWFKVTDAKGTTFTSSATTDAAVTTAPKLAYKNVEFGASPDKYYSMLYAKIDLGDPEIPLVYYTTVNDNTAPVENEVGLANLLSVNNSDELTESAKENWHDLTGVKTAIGGPAKAIYIFVKAKDANGISQITPAFTTAVTLNENEKPVITTPISSKIDNEKSSIALVKIDISNCKNTNDYKLEIKAVDNASRSVSRSFDVSIDKEAPDVYIDSPSENAELYGTAGLPNSNVTVRGRSDADIAKMYMAVTKGGAEKPISVDESDYIDITKNNGISWTVIFNGNKGGISTTDYFEDRFNTWIDTLWGSGTSENPQISEKEICLWFYAEDKLGNKGVASPKELPLKIFTQGDRPSVTITSPDQGGQVGGIITVTGSTSIAIKSVENIWLQIDSNYNGSSFNENWETALTGSGGLLDGKSPEQLGYTIEDSGDTTIGRAIKVGGSKTSWNLAINKASEFNKADNSNRNMAIRAYAISSTGKPSNPVIVSFTLDPNAPVFGQLPGQALRLVQYADNEHGQGPETASRLYESGIDLKGKWWLTGSVSDDSGIVSLQKVTKEVTENVLTNYCSTTGEADAETGCYNYIMKIPLSGEGKLETKLIAQEGANTNKTSEFPIVLNFDNAEPLFECTSLSETEAKQIYQSDGVYEIRGTFNDNSGSDFKRIAFYVTRTVGGINYLTDVMIKQGAEITDNSYVLSTLKHTNNDNKDLYWQTITECKIQNGTEILIKKTQQNLPNYIRRGAVCRINNILYRINKIELNTDTTNNSIYPIKLVVDTKINDAESISVDFALAQIIDNTIKEQGKTNTYDTSYDIGANSNQEKFDNDDNDQMVERYSETSGEWTVSIDSNNIKDGAITIHFVAYDKAGNITYKAYNCVVANNVPRFAGVKFGTDINGDGKVEGDEIKTTYTGWYNIDPENKNKKDGITENGSAANGEKITLWAIPGKTNNITEMDDNADPVMTIKGKLKVIPEIVGGNDGLGWNYKINNGNYIYNKYKEMTGAGHSGSTDIRSTNLTTFEIPDYELISNTSDGENIFTFTISDQTGGAIGGDSASKANLLIKFNVALKDNKAPAAGIKPFYWKSSGKGNNSLYYENNSSVPQGHIELPQDLLERFAYKAEGNIQEGINDIDPKASGKIYLEGFAQDNVVVEKLLLRAYKAGQSAGNFVEVAARNRSEQNPNYGNFEYVSSAAAQGFIGFEITSEKTVTKDGNDYNRIEWKVAIDTSILTGNTADTDIIIEVQAKDRGPASASGQTVTYGTAKESEASTLQTGLKQNAEGTAIALTADTPTFDDSVQTPYYRVDVVPYVTTIETALSSGLKSSIKEAYSRTALGHYITRMGEKILINGFNLAGGTVTFIKNDTETCSTAYDISGISIPDDAKSGKMSVTVNGVETLNNINDNNACGAYKTETTQITEDSLYADKVAYAYNRLPNRTSNNLLTDDLVIDIWQIDSAAAKPRSGELREPSMKINPITGKVGVAFVSGPGDFAMAGGLNNKYDATANADPSKDIYSYSLWQNNYATYNNIAFAYDDLGFAHATGTGLDTNPGSTTLHAGRFSYFYNRWGRSGTDTNGNYRGSNAVRLESLSVPVWKKTTQEASYMKYLAGESMTETTSYLLLKGSIPETDALTETRFYSPSLVATVHGTGDSATTAVYLAYYDSLQGQIRFRYATEIPSTWNSSNTYENWAINKEENTWSVDSNSTYKEEYLTGSYPTIDKGVLKDGGFEYLHHGNNDVDDFVDNLGYFRKENTYQTYMEANTDHFSLIAGVDYQLNSNNDKDKNDMHVQTDSTKKINVDKVDENGNAYEEGVVRYRYGKVDKYRIVTDGNDYFKIKTIDDVKYLYKSDTTETYEISGEGENTVLINRIEGDDANYGKTSYKVCTDSYSANIKDYGYLIFDRVLGDDGKPVDSSATKAYMIPTVETQQVNVTQQTQYPTGYDTGYSAYKYVAIDSKAGSDAANDVVVAVWFDGTNCRYAYNTNPSSGIDNGPAGGWDGNKIIFTEGGEHCTVKFDPLGGVHIAAYVDGSLRYAYLSRHDSEYQEARDSVLVDSFTITGERINLDVGLVQVEDDYVAVPYITYYNGTARKPTVAKLVIPETLPEDYKSVIYKAQGTGTNDGRDIFTGNWEISLVPTTSTLTSQYYDKMNIGLWKVGNADGETRQKGLIVASNDSKFTISKDKTSGSNTSTTNQGDIYGNGTANPILGYAVESISGTFFETAQMK